jgi:hypothetical protein
MSVMAIFHQLRAVSLFPMTAQGATLVNLSDGGAASESWAFKQNTVREYG